MMALLLAIYWAFMADPHLVIGNPEPYPSWFVFIAKAKRLLLPWHWRSK